MTQRTWVILGATSIIAEEFARLAALAGHGLRLIGRNEQELRVISKDIELRFKVPCDIMVIDFINSAKQLIASVKPCDTELDLFIAHSDCTSNELLDNQSITHLVEINILATAQLIHNYLNSKQTKHNLVYLSSVAADRGRSKNSLYGGSKAAIEVYLEGLQQAAQSTQNICIARLGFIDTKQTWGVPGIFYAASPLDCAKACWDAINNKKRLIYYPYFWRFIMAIMTKIPFVLYKRLGSL
jgi:short-subunit dehydrogenase